MKNNKVKLSPIQRKKRNKVILTSIKWSFFGISTAGFLTFIGLAVAIMNGANIHSAGLGYGLVIFLFALAFALLWIFLGVQSKKKQSKGIDEEKFFSPIKPKYDEKPNFEVKTKPLTNDEREKLQNAHFYNDNNDELKFGNEPENSDKKQDI